MIECYRAASSLNRLQAITSGNHDNQGPAPMDIGAKWYNKGKGKKREGQRKVQRQRPWLLGEQLPLQRLQRKRQNQPVGQGNPFKGQQGFSKEKGYSNKGKGKAYYNNQRGGKGAKGKHARNVCYRCGQPGHMAKQCRVAIYNCDTGNFDAQTNRQMTGTVKHTMTALAPGSNTGTTASTGTSRFISTPDYKKQQLP